MKKAPIDYIPRYEWTGGACIAVILQVPFELSAS